MVIYYNLFAMICLYILWIMKELIFSISMKLTGDQPSPVYSQNSDSTLWICLFVSHLLISDYSSTYFCCFCWSLQSCPQHIEVHRSNICFDRIFLSLQLHSQEKVWSTFFVWFQSTFLLTMFYEILKCSIINPSWNLQIISLH